MRTSKPRAVVTPRRQPRAEPTDGAPTTNEPSTADLPGVPSAIPPLDGGPKQSVEPAARVGAAEPAASRAAVERPANRAATAKPATAEPSPRRGRPRLPCIEYLPWKLHKIELPPPRLTRPPRIFISPWDLRVRRFTSPRYIQARLFSPISPLPPSPRSPPRTVRCQTTQTSTTEVHTQGTQTRGWTTSESDSEPEPECPYGPIRVTVTAPHISYRERNLNYRASR
ncbi:PREDICTED: proline-rich receptor-like protein kinase PERK9 [Vollenhovia emeryi]|uniref:proline-rich receptor-like protein kinase PERK9 n=1 Tax=Vollenhovia emeryi TaxID=411798 RepID=UPI0005F501EA|nr:PREDICTED: proline-rich receptor-like protein kinase PERK9 [Vollenhovia emeryi]